MHEDHARIVLINPFPIRMSREDHSKRLILLQQQRTNSVKFQYRKCCGPDVHDLQKITHNTFEFVKISASVDEYFMFRQIGNEIATILVTVKERTLYRVTVEEVDSANGRPRLNDVFK